jgi:ABC-type nitrate/sulfonate/bicarbonate transport system permease component
MVEQTTTGQISEITQASSRSARTLPSISLQVLSPAALLALWELSARLGFIEIKFFPAPSAIAATFWQLAWTGQFWQDIGISIGRMVIGFFMGAVPGLLLGLAMGLFMPVRNIFQPLIAAIYPLPKIALLPLILLVFGLGEMSKYVIVAIGVFFLMAINAMAGVINIPSIYFDVPKNLKASRWKIYATVAFPGALAGIFVGLRICVGTALLLLVAAEFVGADEGIGFRLWWSWTVFWVNNMYVGFAVIAVLGFLLNFIVDYCERRWLPWQGQ